MKRPEQAFTPAAMSMLRGLSAASAAGVLAFAWALHRRSGRQPAARRRIFTAAQWREDRRHEDELAAELKGGAR